LRRVQRNRAEQGLRNLVIGEIERLLREHINEAGKDARALCGSRYNNSLGIALAFVIEEEEILVLAQGSTERSAILIAVQGLGSDCEEIARVEGAVAEEVVEIAVEGVGAGLGDDRGRRAARWPYSAGALRVRMRNSATASTGMRMA
jgi:hypothetical protein